jgi:hypothetical protein
MAINETVYDINISSVVAAAYASATVYGYFDFANGENCAANLRVGDITNTGNLKVKVQHSVEGGASGDWIDVGEMPTITTTSAVATMMSASQLLPYGRAAIKLESTHASGTTVKNLVGKILTELK